MNVSHEGAKANNTKYDKTKKKQKTCARRTKLKVYIPLSSFYYPKFDSSPLYSLFWVHKIIEHHTFNNTYKD